MVPDARFFLDRGLGSRIVPTGLRDAGWTLTTMDERYGVGRSQTIDDATWIRDASINRETIITKDKNIAKRPLEAEAIYYTEARVLVIVAAQISGPEMLQRLLDNSARIQRHLTKTGPWVLGIYRDRVNRIRLAYP